MTYYHRNEWPWGRSTIINTRDGAATVKVSIENYEPKTAYISALSVVEEERHKGYGHDLLILAEDEARRLGARVCKLSSVDGSFTLDWYQREGYVIERHSDYEGGTLLRKNVQ
jgi:GNAT superfamily N-acetyltransferase